MARILRTEPAKTLGMRMWQAVEDHDEKLLREIHGECCDASAALFREHGKKAEGSDAHIDLGCIVLDCRNALKGLFWDDVPDLTIEG